ncbi:MAG TPA: bifunctional 4-hydroxy-2-oxoglutarate aldolase/2-dehydro-3-deoxy-phosphogluconate aldolase [Chthoniobacteraceae bacterium]|nr:bifunctional 4-hydroxy-2-oxoglutarate aldolase/2-dehydro-3-deoxy-phosphogluconate aldolase [Chthoniobacteraceae bacterium]
MNKLEIIDRLLNPGIIAIIRADRPDRLLKAAEALCAGGVPTMEISMTTPGALEAIAEVARTLGPPIVIGVGTVLDPETARAALLAGAQFVVTPVFRPEVISLCHRYGVPVFSGAYTPTEALVAHECGADFIKLFPADQLGPGYVKNLLAPMPQLRIVPTGGVTRENAAAYFAAGCAALGVGSCLVNAAVLEQEDWAGLRARAADLVAAVSRG